MKRKRYTLASTPVFPSLCAIGATVLWYLTLATDNGEWIVEMTPLSLQGMSAFSIYSQIISLAVPVAFFVAALFLSEKSPRWMLLALAVPVIQQLSYFIYYLQDTDALLDAPLQYILPFLALGLYAFTVEGFLPKWVLILFCLAAALLPVGLTLGGIGEFVWSTRAFDYTLYTYIDHTVQEWSAVLFQTLYYLGLGIFALQLKTKPEETAGEQTAPAEEAPVTEAPEEAPAEEAPAEEASSEDPAV